MIVFYQNNMLKEECMFPEFSISIFSLLKIYILKNELINHRISETPVYKHKCDLTSIMLPHFNWQGSSFRPVTYIIDYSYT